VKSESCVKSETVIKESKKPKAAAATDTGNRKRLTLCPPYENEREKKEEEKQGDERSCEKIVKMATSVSK
jgi:hypothetical protein